jgi:hypothetical protein
MGVKLTVLQWGRWPRPAPIILIMNRQTKLVYSRGDPIGVNVSVEERAAPPTGDHKGPYKHEVKTLLHYNTHYTHYTHYTCYTPTAFLQQFHRQRAMTGLLPASPLGYRWRRIGTRATSSLHADAGDHKGPPHCSHPPSPLRTIGRFFVMLTPMGATLAVALKARPGRFRRFLT